MATLQADKKIPFSISGVDEVGNAVPLGASVPAFTVDRPDLLTLTVAEDGFSGEVAATGVLGTAVLSVEGVTDGGVTYRGSVAVDVVPGDVTGVSFALGDPVEVTPDEETPAEPTP